MINAYFSRVRVIIGQQLEVLIWVAVIREEERPGSGWIIPEWRTGVEPLRLLLVLLLKGDANTAEEDDKGQFRHFCNLKSGWNNKILIIQPSLIDILLCRSDVTQNYEVNRLVTHHHYLYKTVSHDNCTRKDTTWPSNDDELVDDRPFKFSCILFSLFCCYFYAFSSIFCRRRI